MRDTPKKQRGQIKQPGDLSVMQKMQLGVIKMTGLDNNSRS